MGWQQEGCNISVNPKATLVLDARAVLAYEPPLWAERFPEVASIEHDLPCVPVHNRVVDNIYCGAVLFMDDGHGKPLNATHAAAAWHSTVANNREVPAGCAA